MTTPITDNWIAEQEAICAKATEGPWQNYYNRRKVFRSANPYPDTNSLQVVGEMERFADGDFAASARTALPLALAELRRLREREAKLDSKVLAMEQWGFALGVIAMNESVGPLARKLAQSGLDRATEIREAALAARERGE